MKKTLALSAIFIIAVFLFSFNSSTNTENPGTNTDSTSTSYDSTTKNNDTSLPTNKKLLTIGELDTNTNFNAGYFTQRDSLLYLIKDGNFYAMTMSCRDLSDMFDNAGLKYIYFIFTNFKPRQSNAQFLDNNGFNQLNLSKTGKAIPIHSGQDESNSHWFRPSKFYFSDISKFIQDLKEMDGLDLSDDATIDNYKVYIEPYPAQDDYGDDYVGLKISLKNNKTGNLTNAKSNTHPCPYCY